MASGVSKLAQEDLLNIQEELIKEVLEAFEEEINFWLENHEKGPLEKTLVERLLAMPDCLPDDMEQLGKVREKIGYYTDHREELIALIEAQEANRDRFRFLVDKLNGKQPPYRAGLTEDEWDELLTMVCPCLLPDETEEPVAIEGLSSNTDILAINEINNKFIPEKQRLNILYTLKDTINLSNTKLEIFRVADGDTIMFASFNELPLGNSIKFKDSDDKEGWRGFNKDNKLGREGEYLVKLTASVDQSFSNGFEDNKIITIYSTIAKIWVDLNKED